jgi:hypothetical protein
MVRANDKRPGGEGCSKRLPRCRRCDMICGTEMYEHETTELDVSREQAIRAELQRLLESAQFRTSKRCKEFLEYIVEHTMHGPSGTLKERSIGVELFQLPQDFDPGQHTIVRVTANEVRKKLAQHYLAENGSVDPVRIEVPPGSYRAEFRWEIAAQPPVLESSSEPPVTEPPVPELPVAKPQVPSRKIWLSRPVMVSVAAILVIAAAVALSRRSAVNPISFGTTSNTGSAGVVNVAIGNMAMGEELRMIVGSTNSYIDRSGRTWSADRYSSGGSVLFRPAQRIARTLDPDIYRHLRQGDFQYDIPLTPGSYELHLYFAETGLADFISAESSGEGQRLFRITVNGNRVLNAFDVVADADGSNVADERVFRNVSPAEDGVLHLSFSGIRGMAMLSGIEVLPVSAGKVRPIRIRAGWTSSWKDSAGQQWQADSYFLGGNALVRTTNPAQQGNSMSPDMALYASERWGHFSYALPVADGRYRVTLKFCEGHYGRLNTGVGGVGSRVFDVYCNGVALLRNFDISKEAGGEGRPVDRTFSGVRPTAQGKIVVSFVPINGMACVNGIEIVDDSK